MKKDVISPLLVMFIIAGAMIVGSGKATSDVPAPPAIGATIEDFSLSGADGKEQALASLKGKNGSVLIFVAVQCPVSNA